MLVTKSKYAELRKCDLKSVYALIKSKKVRVTKKKVAGNITLDYIDTVKYPPVRLRKEGGGRKKKVVSKLKKMKVKK